MSPYYHNGKSVNGYIVLNGGDYLYQSTLISNGVRPAVSLKPETEYTSGDGSMNNPFIVE